MKAKSALVYALALAGLNLPRAAVHAQSAREAAVAIDRIALPPVDTVDVERLMTGLRLPWSMAFLPDGRLLIVEKHHGLRLLGTDGRLGPLMEGAPPNALREADSGFLDVALDPEFTRNRRIYLAFAEGSLAVNRTAIWRAELAADRLTGGRVIFRVNVAKRGPAHPGGRLLFLPDNTLLLTVGDGFDYRSAAQDPASHLGKILRLTREGAAPPDNPYIGRTGYASEVWTLGHRNVQGLALDPQTGVIWANEHGPRGGDEVNRLRPGLNYGWPLVSHGIDYDGTIITEHAFAPGLEPSQFVWSPSIAPSGLAIYRGSRHANWDGRVFAGALAARMLVRLRIGSDTGLFVEEERMLTGLRARIRDVRVGPAGHVYLLTDDPTNGMLLRLVPRTGTAG